MCLAVDIDKLRVIVRVFWDCDDRTVKSERLHLFRISLDSFVP